MLLLVICKDPGPGPHAVSPGIEGDGKTVIYAKLAYNWYVGPVSHFMGITDPHPASDLFNP